MMKSLPLSLSGLYLISFTNLTLQPIRMSDRRPNDIMLKEIRFENGVGIAEFVKDGENLLVVLDVKFDPEQWVYRFRFENADHHFSIRSSFAKEVSNITDIFSVRDLNVADLSD